jgi:hypothetical protein
MCWKVEAESFQKSFRISNPFSISCGPSRRRQKIVHSHELLAPSLILTLHFVFTHPLYILSSLCKRTVHHCFFLVASGSGFHFLSVSLLKKRRVFEGEHRHHKDHFHCIICFVELDFFMMQFG